MRDDPSSDRSYPAEKVRQGEIILRRRWQRAVFITGLVLLALGVQFAPHL